MAQELAAAVRPQKDSTMDAADGAFSCSGLYLGISWRQVDLKSYVRWSIAST